MKARFARSLAPLGRAHRASTVGFLLTLLAAGPASAQGEIEQRKARAPDAYRLAGEIPNAGSITAGPRRDKANLGPSSAAEFE